MAQVGDAVDVYRAGGYELSVVKWSDRRSNAVSYVWAAVGSAILLLTSGWFGWTLDPTEPRWLVQLQHDDSTEPRTLWGSFTRRGARRRARRILRLLKRGDIDAVRQLPDYTSTKLL